MITLARPNTIIHLTLRLQKVRIPFLWLNNYYNLYISFEHNFFDFYIIILISFNGSFDVSICCKIAPVIQSFFPIRCFQLINFYTKNISNCKYTVPLVHRVLLKPTDYFHTFHAFHLIKNLTWFYATIHIRKLNSKQKLLSQVNQDERTK